MEGDQERRAWDTGEVDARACVHCETLTYAHHMPLVAQTNLKSPPPPFLEEIQREMRVVVEQADHIVLMGYSLPRDDVTYRAFLAARISSRVSKDESSRVSKDEVRCSVVGKENGYDSCWLYPDELAAERRDLPDVVRSAQSLFGPKNVRFYGAGIPDVFLDGGTTVTDRAVDSLLTWDR